MQKNRSEDDAQNESYNEFKKNSERKIWEDNLKALEDESKTPLFPGQDNDLWKKDRVKINEMVTPLDELWKKGMAKKADPESVREEVDSLSDDGQYDVTIYFGNLTPEGVGWIMGKMNSYIHMARSIDITSIN